MQKIISTVCAVAILINVCLFGIAYLTNESGLLWLSFANVALLGTRFIIFKGEQQ